MLVCGPDVMRPSNDDENAVATRSKKRKSKSNDKSNVNFEPEKYEAALRSILGKVIYIKSGEFIYNALYNF